MTEAERTLWWATSTPGGTAPFSANSLAARISRWRAMMMPLSVETEILLGAVDDRPHAFLQRAILDRDAIDAAIGLAAPLSVAIHQIVVVLVGERPEAARECTGNGCPCRPPWRGVRVR